MCVCVGVCVCVSCVLGTWQYLDLGRRARLYFYKKKKKAGLPSFTCSDVCVTWLLIHRVDGFLSVVF